MLHAVMKYMKILFVYRQMAHMAYQKIQSNYGSSAYIATASRP